MVSDQQIAEDEALASAPHKSVPGPGWQWYLVIVLGMTAALSGADKNGLNLIVNPIRADLGISDTKIGLLIGPFFTFLFCACSLPAGHLVDRVNRRRLLVGAIGFWSCMTVLCGFATHYGALSLARAGMGIGEAALYPACYSLIRDGVSSRNWGRAFAVFHIVGGAGSNLGTLVGGTIYGLATAGALTAIPVLGGLAPWRDVIVIPGLFGVVVAGVLLTIREPARIAPRRVSASSFGEAFAYVRQHWRVYVPIFCGYFMILIAYSGWITWIAAALGRSWNMSPSTIGKTAGSIALLLGPVPSFLYGYVMDRLKTKGRLGAPYAVAAAGLVLNATVAVAMLLAPSVHAMWLLYGLAMLCSTSCVGTVTSIMLSEVTPDHLMGKVTAIYNLVAYLMGNMTGPIIFATVAQYCFSGPKATAHSMLVCYPTVMGLTAAMMLFGQHQMRRWCGPANP